MTKRITIADARLWGAKRFLIGAFSRQRPSRFAAMPVETVETVTVAGPESPDSVERSLGPEGRRKR